MAFLSGTHPGNLHMRTSFSVPFSFFTFWGGGGISVFSDERPLPESAGIADDSKNNGGGKMPVMEDGCVVFVTDNDDDDDDDGVIWNGSESGVSNEILLAELLRSLYKGLSSINFKEKILSDFPLVKGVP